MLICGAVVLIAAGTTSYAQLATESAEPQRVEIDKTSQVLRAYEGNVLVIETNVSTGRRGKETPNGSYQASEKDIMHYSRLYDHAPMPYSIQVANNYFIHGFRYVPSYPASHGCIRVPVGAAKKLYSWIRLGTPIEIYGRWQGGSAAKPGAKHVPLSDPERNRTPSKAQNLTSEAVANQTYRINRTGRIYPPD